MTLQQLIPRISYHLLGVQDTAPTIGDDNWIYWVSIANSKKDEMYDDPNQTWASAFSVQSVGTIAVAAAPSFNLAGGVLATLLEPSDEVYVIDSNGQYHYYDIIKPKERNPQLLSHQVYLAGRNPVVLYFTNAIVTGEQIVGGTLYLPGYYRPADIDVTDNNAYIPVDDPNWLAMAVAAEIAFNDITYQDRYADLAGKANVLYHNMSRRNRRGTFNRPRITPTHVKRITGFRR